MRMRPLTPDEADKVWSILVQHVGASPEPREREAFVHAAARDTYRCSEYRFVGSLGFGGKFRNNGNNDGIPYVDYYQEHETEGRRRMIIAANEALAELFAPPPSSDMEKSAMSDTQDSGWRTIDDNTPKVRQLWLCVSSEDEWLYGMGYFSHLTINGKHLLIGWKWEEHPTHWMLPTPPDEHGDMLRAAEKSETQS